MLDGDALREVMAAEDAHTRSERLAIGMKYARLCRLLASQNLTVAIATISMFKEVHAWNRQNIPGYVEVFLDVPLDELIQRDPKQIYQRALRAEISNVAGLDLEVDVPQDPDVVLHGGNGVTADMAFAELLKQIGARDDRA